ncbi:uncharacterized protein STEHIDRAFT_145494 [Stereum hirsutum FP-91666 SS1]|uniref:uncharacterized protein n=1 Tax=Stereum hirsutum (strain FP-91666) TaxID=721885 RepID=UPI000440A1F9|nr:uncharacterized protein STEHIDRAFT_145494 [Stereum hirsutum FP-91666 SS1]EIM90410.1 hypothetical protein STEHIDRAFT_145494 [Stereum hirsutum FP-91666 SS1]
MSAVSSPLNAAHQHAANADDYLSQGLFIPASEEHKKAADAFQACVEASNDENAKRTLRMLYNEHIKEAKELQRKVDKLKEDGIDPSLPQKLSSPTRPSPTPSNISRGPSPTPTSNLRGPSMIDSQQTVDESFMVLGQQSADAGDAFNKFWKAMETLDHLSQPVAFATASLGFHEVSRRTLKREGSNSSDTDVEDTIRSRKGFARGQSRALSPDNSFATAYDGDAGGARSTMAKSSRISQSIVDLRNDFDEIVDEDYDSSDSFCMIPSKSEPSTSTLKKEVSSLKSELEAVRKQLETAERTIRIRKEQDHQLRDNIVVARTQAQRAMGASAVIQRPGQSAFDLNALNMALPPMPSAILPVPTVPNRDKEAQLSRRVKELEEEVRAVRIENEKQKAMINKFREKWDKLKESAKRKREARAASGAHNSTVHERIDEEPEAEAEQDEAQAQA